MNILRLNTLNDDKVIVRGNGGGAASTIEYVDISTADEDVKKLMMSFSIATKVLMMGTIGIGTSSSVVEIISVGAPIDNILASSFDLNMDILQLNSNELETVKDNLIVNELWETYSSLPRITKEEFYHIPQDEIWTLNTQDDYKTAWDKLYPLIERYGSDYIYKNRLSLAPWYKSLSINGFGANNIIDYYVDIREDDEFIKYESIGLDSCDLRRTEWNDGRVTFDFVEYAE